MSDNQPDPNEPRDPFELFARTFGFLGLIVSSLLVHFFILTPWEEAKNKTGHVVYSITAIGITAWSSLWTIALIIGGLHGSRLITDMAQARFGWRQNVFIFVWATVTLGIYILLKQHFKLHGYST